MKRGFFLPPPKAAANLAGGPTALLEVDDKVCFVSAYFARASFTLPFFDLSGVRSNIITCYGNETGNYFLYYYMETERVSR